MNALFSTETLNFFSVNDFKQKFNIASISIGHDQNAGPDDVYASGDHAGQQRIWAMAKTYQGQELTMLVSGSFINKMNQGAEAVVMCDKTKGGSPSDYMFNAVLRKPKQLDVKFTL